MKIIHKKNIPLNIIYYYDVTIDCIVIYTKCLSTTKYGIQTVDDMGFGASLFFSMQVYSLIPNS